MLKYALLGERLSHSLSPEIHAEIFKALDIKASYTLVETSPAGIEEKLKKYDGLNVTIPYKTEVVKHLESLSDEAKKIGAVNTIYEGKGYNTDYYGFGKMLEINDIPVKDQVIYILGTGGASKAVDQYLKDHGAKKIIFVSRSKKGINIINYDTLNEASGDLIINTTPVGMYPKIDESPITKEVVKKFKYAVDLIYNPFETEFLRLAKTENLITTNGLYMLVGQGVKAEEIWQNRVISDDLINKIHEMLRK